MKIKASLVLIVTLSFLLLGSWNAIADYKSNDRNLKSDSLLNFLLKSSSMKVEYLNDIQNIIKEAKLQSNKQKVADGYYLLGKYYFTLKNHLEKATQYYLIS